jgi:hypothetical protein
MQFKASVRTRCFDDQLPYRQADKAMDLPHASRRRLLTSMRCLVCIATFFCVCAFLAAFNAITDDSKPNRHRPSQLAKVDASLLSSAVLTAPSPIAAMASSGPPPPRPRPTQSAEPAVRAVTGLALLPWAAQRRPIQGIAAPTFSNRTTKPTQSTAEPPPRGVSLEAAARSVLLRGCGPLSETNADGVACEANGLSELLATPAAARFSSELRNPCTRPAADAPSVCIPYFYVLGAYHGGVRDLYSRLVGHPEIFVPEARIRKESETYPYYLTETHPWERMLWRGCDYGRCPLRRGAGAEPLLLSDLPELSHQEQGTGNTSAVRVFGEVSPSALTFTWSSTHTLLHQPFDRNLSACRSHLTIWTRESWRGCFLDSVDAQRDWETSIGGGRKQRFTVPWLMR